MHELEPNKASIRVMMRRGTIINNHFINITFLCSISVFLFIKTL